MLFLRRSLAYFLIFLTFDAAAFKAPVGYMQNTISGLIQQKAVKRGFAPVDPRYGATLDAVSSVVGGAAAGAATVALAGLTAPAWVTAAIAFGIGAVVTVGVSYAADGAVKWLFGDKDITRTKGANAPPQYAGLGAGQPYWRTDGDIIAADPFSVAQAWFSDKYATVYSKRTDADFWLASVVANGADYVYTVDMKNRSSGSITSRYDSGRIVKVANAPFGCPTGQVGVGTVCTAPAPYPDASPAAQPVKLTPQEAITELTPQELAQPVNPALMAAMADKLWRDAAAKPGYAGLPYRADDPITETEVQTWRQANPQSYPTVQDLVKPEPATNAPWTLPTSVNPVTTQETTSPSPSAGTNPAAANPLQNLGTDPGIGSPTLEEIPTPPQILKPIFDLMPDMRSVNLSHAAVQCPVAKFDVWGQSFVIDSHCVLIEQQRAAIAALMAAAWALLSAFIVLKA